MEEKCVILGTEDVQHWIGIHDQKAACEAKDYFDMQVAVCLLQIC